jgi:maleate cis-trans isomerase
MFLASYIEMLTIHFSRFPTLVVVAQELKNEEENANGSTSSLSNSEVILIEGA